MYAKKRHRLKNGSAAKMVGAQLATFRRAAGYTQESLAERAVIGADTIASIEQGRRLLKPDQADLLDKLLDTKGTLAAALEHMPEMGMTPLWTQQLFELEKDAATISSYENQVVPGLLQTEPYTRAVFGNRLPAYTHDELALHTSERLDRQALFQQKAPPTVTFVLWEPILHLHLSTDAEHKEQIRHLRTMADLPGLTLQVLPLDVRGHAALSGTFVLFETRDHRQVGYTELVGGARIHEDPEIVSLLAQRHAMLRTQALNIQDTKSLLERLGE
ncbi:helix-turn-helix domain-containing protein [Streptomyces sp. 8L]|uniref:helix-turn-helix domain-containing protein n=1 Tax=Streptomyces sp. 8L TaxID=2877242 RepID=UPI001CD3110A|nr:helix-turn-helix transcriptional regulator [Streptomyces sp. 8L]MCA1220714.1 helix-turn-helix domain-containing protein [Streptomyces sp. 8L]